MRETGIDLKKLRSFYLVAKHGSLREAASHLLLSTSAVSIQINQLEVELGVKLFDRIGRKLVLATAGAVFLRHVQAIFDAVDSAIESVADSEKTRERIAIAVGTDLTRVFAESIGRFMRNHPEVEITLQLKHSPESLTRVLEGDIDMAIGYFSKLPKDLEKQTLMRSGFSISFSESHPIANIPHPRISDLASYPVISLRKETDIGQRILHAFDTIGSKPVNFLEVGNCQSSQDLAAQGIGVAYAHKTCLGGYHGAGMCSIDATSMLGSVDVAVVRSKFRNLTSLHREFLDEMAEATKSKHDAA